MERRRFGKTELAMPALSFGCMRFQQSWNRGEKRISKFSQANLEKIVERALELGINHFETARGYGTSEAQLGRVLPHLDRESLILQTKVAPSAKAGKFLADVRDSMKTLRVDRLDLLAFHGVNDRNVLDEVLRKGGCMKVARKLKEDGVIGHIGFSAHGGPDGVLPAIRSGEFEYVNLWYSYIFPDNAQAIREANRRDMGVFIISPNDKGGRLFDPPAILRRLTKPLTPMQFNDLFILQNSGVHTISCGASRPSDFDEHVEALNNARKRQKTVDIIRRRLDRRMEDAVGRDWAAHYRDGLPAWDKTPGRVNIPTVLWLGNLVLAYDLVEYGKFRYNLMGSAGHWFPGMNADGLDKVDAGEFAKAVRRSPFAGRIAGALRDAGRRLGGAKVGRLSRE